MWDAILLAVPFWIVWILLQATVPQTIKELGAFLLARAMADMKTLCSYPPVTSLNVTTDSFSSIFDIGPMICPTVLIAAKALIYVVVLLVFFLPILMRILLEECSQSTPKVETFHAPDSGRNQCSGLRLDLQRCEQKRADNARNEERLHWCRYHRLQGVFKRN